MKYIETERLILREWTLNDVNDQVEGLNNFETAKNLTVPFPYTKEDSITYISKHLKNTLSIYAFAVQLKSSNKVIGGTNLDIKDGKYHGGIWLNEKYTGKGYGTEVWLARIKFAFEFLKLNELENGYYDFNNRSRLMQEKVGYKVVGKSSKFCPALNKEVVEILTLLTKENFNIALKSAKLKAIYDKIKILLFWYCKIKFNFLIKIRISKLCKKRKANFTI